MFKILKHLKIKEWLIIVAISAFIFSSVWLDLRIPEYMTDLTVLITQKGNLMSDILTVGGKMLGCALLSFVASVIVGFFAARIASSLSARLRGDIFNNVSSFSMSEINKFSTASLITRSTNDVTQIEMLVAMGLQLIIKAPIMAVLAIRKIQSTGTWQWSMLTVGAVIFLLVAIISIMAYVMPKFRKIQGLTDNLNRVTRENLTGLRVVRAYNAEKYEENKFSTANDELTNTNLKAQKALVTINPTMGILMNGISLGIYWIGAYLIDGAGMLDKITLFSNMVVFMSYAMQVIMAFMMLTMTFIMLPRALVSAKRINEILDTETSVTDGNLTEGKSGFGEVEFKNVSFKYPDAEEYILHDISFTAHKGETVAFIGATGCGKSTIINLVSRFYDATDGEVLVDGVNVKDYTLNALNNKIGYVSQRAILFSGSMKTNVAFGENGKEAPTDSDIKKAIEIAQASEFIESLPEKENSAVAQLGANLSGGQKQRVSIARAIARKPEIYIFDDSFSALDYKTDRILRSAMKKETGDATKLIVAQRIGTIKDADCIVVIEDGAVVGMGKHSELMKNCSVYQEIAYSQLSKEELA